MYLKRRVVMLFALLVVAASRDPREDAAYAATVTGATTRSVSHGIALTLIVPHTKYLQRALVRVTLIARNVSGMTKTLTYVCGGTPLGAVSTSKSGWMEYPLVFRNPPGIVGVACSRSVLLPAHHSTRLDTYVVVRGSAIRGFVSLDSGSRIYTRPVPLALTRTRVPYTSVSRVGAVQAVVQRPAGATGPLVSFGYSICLTHGLPFTEVDHQWATMAHDVALPPYRPPACARVIEWHAFAGYAGYPVDTIDCKAP